MMDKLYKIAEGLNARFPDGNDPFMIVTRLAEECGEVAAEVNHFERTGVKVDRRGAPDRHKLAKELQDVMRAVLQLALYYDLQDEPLADIPVESDGIRHRTRGNRASPLTEH
jgi:NTP pyrophosphatase (non-canonical NTP hydrolase)